MDEIMLSHGAGGQDYRNLVEEVFLPAYGSKELQKLQDAACCQVKGPVAFTTDGFVVDPLFFPGGDIGSLCVSGTVNDLAVSGAIPRFLSISMILEAGFSMITLKTIVASIAKTAKAAKVSIVTGDTKVVEKGRAGGIYITTTGIGTFDGEWILPMQQTQIGDALILTSSIANHGAAVMAARENLAFDPLPQSDARPLNELLQMLLQSGIQVHAMRDPTRGGVGASLCEWVNPEIDLCIEENKLPLLSSTKAFCELLGLDPLFVANEGVCLLALPQKESEKALSILKSHPFGQDAQCIGWVRKGTGQVLYQTQYGTQRRIALPAGEILPRIC